MFGKRKIWIPAAAIVVAILAAVAYFEYRKVIRDPGISLLIPEGGAQWILFPNRIELNLMEPGHFLATFEKRFRIDSPPHEAVLTLKAFKGAQVMIDGKVVLQPQRKLDDWKNTLQVDIAPLLTSGEHEIIIAVVNENAPPALLAYCGEIGLYTGPDWLSNDGTLDWANAVTADNIKPVPLSLRFPRADRAFVSRLPYILPIFIIVFIWAFKTQKNNSPEWLTKIAPDAGRLRWMLLAAWAVLGINDMMKLPFIIGFDLTGHLKYIEYLATRWRIPLANEGWSMFNSPLYYIVSLPIHLIFSRWGGDPAQHALRIIPIICGALQIELSYRALKHVYPDQNDMQALGTVIGGLIPMNIYMSQVVGPEPLAGCLSAAVVVMGIGIIKMPRIPRWYVPVLGLSLGLSLLTKLTAILLIPALAIPMFHFVKSNRGRMKQALMLIAGAAALTFVVSGWYYIRNIIVFGKPFVMGSFDPVRGILGWQQPGYRTPGQFITFGESLIRPVLSALFSVWDALYSTFWADGYLGGLLRYDSIPPWNYNFMISSVWFGLPITIAIVAGCLKIFRKPARLEFYFMDMLIGIYFMALIYLYLTLPVYSTGKASYTLGLIPCYAVLSVAGMEPLLNRPILRAVTIAFIATSAVVFYSAYFVV